jgi:hypothetical protein
LIGSSILILIPSQVKMLPGLETAMSPKFIPAAVAVGLIIMGFTLVLQSSLGNLSPDRISWDRVITMRILTAVLLMFAYTALFPRLGFVVTSAVFTGFFTFFFGARSWWKVSLVVLLIPIGVWLFFEKLFRIPLPHGLVF